MSAGNIALLIITIIISIAFVTRALPKTIVMTVYYFERGEYGKVVINVIGIIVDCVILLWLWRKSLAI